MTAENLEKGVVSVRTVIGFFASAIVGTITVCFFLAGLSSQIANVSAKVDMTNAKVDTVSSRTDELRQGQTTIWQAVKGNTDMLNLQAVTIQKHGDQLDELKTAVNRDAEENRAAQKN